MSVVVACIHVTAALLDKDDVISAAKHCIDGYTEVSPLSPTERSILHTVTAARMAQSVTMGAYSYSMSPENTYLLTTAAPGWRLLETLTAMTPAQIAAFNGSVDDK